MSLVDPIADYLTRVRNAIRAKKKFVEMPSSNMKVKISELLKENNFVKDYNVIEDDKQNILRVHLQYVDGQSSISGLKRVSKQGLRQFVGKDDIPRVLNGLGIAILSTSQGLITNQQAKKEQIGGEVICHIW
jgi:small subunit ribosomal protein S8